MLYVDVNLNPTIHFTSLLFYSTHISITKSRLLTVPICKNERNSLFLLNCMVVVIQKLSTSQKDNLMRIMRMSIILKLSGRTGVKGEMKFIKRKVPPCDH